MRARALWLALAGAVVLDGGAPSASVFEWNDAPGALPAYANDVNGRERPRTVVIDGVRLAVAAGATSDAPAAVRRFYAERVRDGQVAVGDAEHGALGGLDLGGAPSAAELGARFARLAETGDLGALGQLQLVWFEPRAGGGTSYLDLWTEGGLPIDALLPPAGDVAGGDLDGVPRPDGAVRTLAIGEAGRGERLRGYRVAGASLVAVRDFYVGELGARGWAVDRRFGRFAAARGRNQLRLGHEGRELYLDFTRHGDDVDVVAIELGR